jgi:hypothetical protein
MKTANCRIGWKGFPLTNTLAFWSAMLVTNKKVFMTLALDDNVPKLFSFSLTLLPSLYILIIFDN